jgi:hypothetical protein
LGSLERAFCFAIPAGMKVASAVGARGEGFYPQI